MSTSTLQLSALVTAFVLTMAANASLADRDGDRGRGSSYRGRDRGDVTVNIFGGARNIYRTPNRNINRWSIHNTWGYGVGYSSFGGNYFLNYGYPYSPWNYNPPVVVEKHIHIENSTPRSRARVYSNRPIGTSLLRDLDGRCWERDVDGQGNEMRTELDPSECNF